MIQGYFSQIAVLPQGSTRPVSVTGRPISSLEILPPNFFFIIVPIRYSITEGERPVVYELRIKKRGSSLIMGIHILTKPKSCSSSFHTSPPGPLP